jgi:hypothetical protein
MQQYFTVCTAKTDHFIVNFEGKMSEKKWALNNKLARDIVTYQ